jgi:hypothetical protein
MLMDKKMFVEGTGRAASYRIEISIPKSKKEENSTTDSTDLTDFWFGIFSFVRAVCG